MGKKRVYCIIKGINMNSKVPKGPRQRDKQRKDSDWIPYADKSQYSNLKPEDISQPEGKVFKG